MPFLVFLTTRYVYIMSKGRYNDDSKFDLSVMSVYRSVDTLIE